MLAPQGHCCTPQHHCFCKTIPSPPEHVLLNPEHDLWDLVNVTSPHGFRYCLLVIDHHTHYMWVLFLKSKDDTGYELETILLEIRYLHARHHS
jgi:hypothetical protein